MCDYALMQVASFMLCVSSVGCVWGCQVVRKAVRWEATHVPQSPLFHTFHNYTRSTITIVWSLPLMFFLQACVVCWWWKFSDEVWMRSSSPSRRRWNGNCQRETQQFVQGGGEEHKTLENVWPTRKKKCYHLVSDSHKMHWSYYTSS